MRLPSIVLATCIFIAIPAYTSGRESKDLEKASQSNANTAQKFYYGQTTVVEQQEANTGPAGKQHQTEHADGPKATHDRIDYINAWSTAVIALFTVLLFVGVVWQVRTSRSIERAWILVEIGAAEPTNLEGIIWVAPKVTNEGNTVGRVLRTSITSLSIANPTGKLPPEPDYAKPVEFDFSLAPSKEIRPMKVEFPSQQLQDALNRKAALYVYGFVDYLDLAKKRRKTRFGFVYYVPPYEGDIGPPGFYLASEIPPIYNRCT